MGYFKIGHLLGESSPGYDTGEDIKPDIMEWPRKYNLSLDMDDSYFKKAVSFVNVEMQSIPNFWELKGTKGGLKIFYIAAVNDNIEGFEQGADGKVYFADRTSRRYVALDNIGEKKSYTDSFGYTFILDSFKKLDIPPKKVEILEATAEDEQITVNWRLSDESDVIAYNVHANKVRTHNGFLTQSPHTVTKLRNDEVYEITVEAIDKAGNVSFSDPLFMIPFRRSTIPRLYGLSDNYFNTAYESFVEFIDRSKGEYLYFWEVQVFENGKNKIAIVAINDNIEGFEQGINSGNMVVYFKNLTTHSYKLRYFDVKAEINGTYNDQLYLGGTLKFFKKLTV